MNTPAQAPLVIAHRGDSAHAPENTLAAFALALEKGADGVEFDVRLAKDGVPVVIHDASLKRTAGRDEAVAALTSAQLAGCDASLGSKHGRANTDAGPLHVPTLAETLELLTPSRGGPIYVELKCEDPDPVPLVAAVCEVIQTSPLLGRMIVKSFRLATIPLVRELLPDVRTAALFGDNVRHFLRRKSQMIRIARDLGAHELSIQYRLASRHFVSSCNDAGVPVAIWTVDDEKWIARCQDRGIAAVITNDPSRMLAARDAAAD